MLHMVSASESGNGPRPTFIEALRANPNVGEVVPPHIELGLRRSFLEYNFALLGERTFGQEMRTCTRNLIDFLESPLIQNTFSKYREFNRWHRKMVKDYGDEAYDFFNRNRLNETSLTVALQSIVIIATADDTFPDDLRAELNILRRLFIGEIRPYQGTQIRYLRS